MTFKEDVDLQIAKIERDNVNLQEKKEAYIIKADTEMKLNRRLLEMLQELRGVVPYRNPELFDEVEAIEADTGGHLEDIPDPPTTQRVMPPPPNPEDKILKKVEVISDEELLAEEEVFPEEDEPMEKDDELITEEEEERMGERMEDDESPGPEPLRGKEIPF